MSTNIDPTWAPQQQPQQAWTAPPLWQHSAPAPAVAARPAVQLHTLQLVAYTLLSIASVVFIIGAFYAGMKYLELMSLLSGMGSGMGYS